MCHYISSVVPLTCTCWVVSIIMLMCLHLQIPALNVLAGSGCVLSLLLAIYVSVFTLGYN